MSKIANRQSANQSMIDRLKNGNFVKSTTLSQKDIYEKLTKDSTQKNIEPIKIENLVEAPQEWNFFPKINEDKLLEMIESIYENGLLSPIIVWKIAADNYMILSGHNRKHAFEIIYEAFADERFLEIPAIVYDQDELTEQEAKIIIVDTNYVQRVLSKDLIAKSVIVKYDAVEKKKGQGRTRDIVAKNLGLTGRMVDYYRSLNNLIPEIREMVYENKLSIKAAGKVVVLDQETQHWLYDNFSSNFINKTLYKIKKEMSKDEIKGLFDEKLNLVNISFQIPENLKKDFTMYANNWLNEHQQ